MDKERGKASSVKALSGKPYMHKTALTAIVANDEIELGSKIDFHTIVTHEVGQTNLFNDTDPRLALIQCSVCQP